MCGRIIVAWEEILPVASDTELSDWVREAPEGASSSWNLPPTKEIPIALTSPKTGEKHLELARWWLTPAFAKTFEPNWRYPTFNAKVETLSEKRSFSPSLKAQRCIIPVSGFYEWTGPKDKRIPHAIFGKKKILPLAGLYAWWRSPEGEWKLSATILTRESAGVMKPLHHRMPVFVDDSMIQDWLDPETVGDQSLVDAVAALAVPYSETLTEHAVRPLQGDGPDLLNPA